MICSIFCQQASPLSWGDFQGNLEIYLVALVNGLKTWDQAVMVRVLFEVVVLCSWGYTVLSQYPWPLRNQLIDYMYFWLLILQKTISCITTDQLPRFVIDFFTDQSLCLHSDLFGMKKIIQRVLGMYYSLTPP